MAAAPSVPLTDAMETSTARHPRLAYVPALDGIRAVAVALVLCFHAGFSWMTGGFLGVSTFFTLSGFLITSLLLAEHRSTGRVSLRGFWSRRYRRLLPASLAGLGLVLVLAGTEALPRSPELAGDVLAALAQVANWRFLFDDTTYAELFAAPSPVLHYWSLAIEEQFYVLFPVLVWFVLRRRAAALGPVVAALTAGSVVCAVWLGLAGRGDATYYATPARAAELLLGVLLALALAPGGVVRRLSPAASRLASALGLGALALTVGLAAVASPSDRWLELGGLPAFALVSAALVTGALQPGPLARVLSWRPLVLLGKVSYGVYVFHWPVFLWLDAERTGLDTWPLFGLRLAVTAAIVVPSYLWLESPIRRGWLRQWGPVGALGASAAVMVGALAVPASGGRTAAIDFAAARTELDRLASEGDETAPVTTVAPPERPAAGTLPAGSAPTIAPAPRKLRVAAFGDSTGMMTSLGVGGWGDQDGRLLLNADGTDLGCGIGLDGERRYGPFPAEEIPERCRALRQRYATIVAETRADVALVQAGPFDVADRRLPGDDTWRAPGDPVYDAYLKEQVLRLIDELRGLGVQVAWVTNPRIELGAADSPPPAEPYPVNDPRRMERFNQLIVEAAAERPGTVVLDLAAHLRSLPGGEMDRRLRPDGVHFTLTTAPEVGAWLGPELLRAMADKVDLTAPAPPTTATG